ncbi:hypothetical protein TNCV_2586581 [Trichonephila clavipes]|nr:hypothetical protein TNCV_2586581 [Trichonephila clavipes]
MQKLSVCTQQKREHHGTRSTVKLMPELTILSYAKSLSRDRPQVEVCNTILTADGFPPNDDRATANILGSHYQKMSRLTFNKDDKNTERQAKLAVHKCRSSDLGEPVFWADSSMHELLLVLNALDPKKSPGPDYIHGVMITHRGPRGTNICWIYLINLGKVADCLTSEKEPLSFPLENRARYSVPLRVIGRLL